MIKDKTQKRHKVLERIRMVRNINKRIENPLLDDDFAESLWYVKVGIRFQKKLLRKIADCLLELNKPLFALTMALRQYEISLVAHESEYELSSYKLALLTTRLRNNTHEGIVPIEISLIVLWQYHRDKIDLLLSIAEYWQSKYHARSREIVLFIMSAFQFDTPTSSLGLEEFREVDRRMQRLMFDTNIHNDIESLWRQIARGVLE